jgi:hypothetical protein
MTRSSTPPASGDDHRGPRRDHGEPRMPESF